MADRRETRSRSREVDYKKLNSGEHKDSSSDTEEEKTGKGEVSEINLNFGLFSDTPQQSAGGASRDSAPTSAAEESEIELSRPTFRNETCGRLNYRPRSFAPRVTFGNFEISHDPCGVEEGTGEGQCDKEGEVAQMPNKTPVLKIKKGKPPKAPLDRDLEVVKNLEMANDNVAFQKWHGGARPKLTSSGSASKKSRRSDTESSDSSTSSSESSSPSSSESDSDSSSSTDSDSNYKRSKKRPRKSKNSKKSSKSKKKSSKSHKKKNK